MTEERREYSHWTVDKRVPLALIYVIVSQFILLLVGGVMAYKDLSADARNNRDAIVDIQTYIVAHKEDHRDINNSLLSMRDLSVHLEYLRKDIASIKISVEALQDRKK